MAFHVSFNHDSEGHSYHHNVSRTEPLAFDHVVNNVGNAYSTTTGKFTVPYTGYYLFHLLAM